MEFVKVMRTAMNAKMPECVEAAAYVVLLLAVAVMAVLTVWYIVKLVKAAIEDKLERDRMEKQMVMDRNSEEEPEVRPGSLEFIKYVGEMYRIVNELPHCDGTVIEFSGMDKEPTVRQMTEDKRQAIGHLVRKPEPKRKPYEKPVLEEVKLMNYDQAGAVLGVAHSMVSKLLRQGKLRQLPKKPGERYAPNGGIIAESVYRLAAERQAMLIARAEKALEQVRKQEGRK